MNVKIGPLKPQMGHELDAGIEDVILATEKLIRNADNDYGRVEEDEAAEHHQAIAERACDQLELEIEIARMRTKRG